MDKWQELWEAVEKGRKDIETLGREIMELRRRAEQQNGIEEKAEEGGEGHWKVVVEKPWRAAQRGGGLG